MCRKFNNHTRETGRLMIFSVLLIFIIALPAMAQQYDSNQGPASSDRYQDRYDYTAPGEEPDQDQDQYPYTHPEGQEAPDQYPYTPPEGQQGRPEDPWEQQEQDVPTEFSDDEIDSVAQAYVDIMELREDYQQRMAAVEDPEAAQEIQMEANQRITEAVEAQGIDVETYNNVITAAQRDEALMDELLERIEGLQ
jgi:hypothetical protein